MDIVADIALIAAGVFGCWTVASVAVAIPLSALFRAQARRELRWHQVERRRMWLEAAAR